MPVDAGVLVLLHLLDGAHLSGGPGAGLEDLGVGALAQQLQHLIINMGVGEAVVADHFLEGAGGLLLGGRQGLLRAHLFPI